MAVQLSLAYCDCVDAEGDAEDAGASKAATVGYLGFLGQLGARQVPQYCSVPLRPSPPPCQPRITNIRYLKQITNNFYNNLSNANKFRIVIFVAKAGTSWANSSRLFMRLRE